MAEKEMSAMERADRFVKAFEGLVPEAGGLKPGDKLEVVSIGLAYEDLHGVGPSVTFRRPDGRHVTVAVGHPYFDPDYPGLDGRLEWRPGCFNITEDECRERLQKVGLLEPKDNESDDADTSE